ncbi:hypothetical protein [Methanobrevibacter sp.]|uniref:hypothetical protein n=1 Tax=Methanobrevibacter sp. TaxID=66852 RepID=UPI00389076C7
MTDKYLLKEATLRHIKNKQAEKVLRCIVDYNVNLEFNDAMNLVEYEISIENLIMPNKVEENNLLRFPNIEEKEQIKNAINLELSALNQIKESQWGNKKNNKKSKTIIENNIN